MRSRRNTHLSASCPYRGETARYWPHRYDLLDRFDEVLHDEEGFYSIKPMLIAQAIASRLPGNTAIDAFGGLGGVSIALARAGKTVDTVEIVRTRAAMLRGNLMLYGVSDRVRVYEGDAYEMVPHMRADSLYLDPPWGGPGVLQRQHVGFELFPSGLPEFLTAMRRRFRAVAISLPPNFDRRQLAGDLRPDDVHRGEMWGRDVVVTAFYRR